MSKRFDPTQDEIGLLSLGFPVFRVEMRRGSDSPYGEDGYVRMSKECCGYTSVDGMCATCGLPEGTSVLQLTNRSTMRTMDVTVTEWRNELFYMQTADQDERSPSAVSTQQAAEL